MRADFTEQQLHPYLLGHLALGLCCPFRHLLSAPQECWPSPGSGPLIRSGLHLFYEAGESNWAELDSIRGSLWFFFYDLKGLSRCPLPALLSLPSVLAGPQAHFLGHVSLPLPLPSAPTDREMGPRLLVTPATGHIATHLAMSGHMHLSAQFSRSEIGAWHGWVSVWGLARLKSKRCSTTFLS